MLCLDATGSHRSVPEQAIWVGVQRRPKFAQLVNGRFAQQVENIMSQVAETGCEPGIMALY